MVRTLKLGALTAAIILSLASAPGREYQIGQTAEMDIRTPAPLVVVDTEATDALKQKEAQRVPVIYRYFPHAINEVEAAFHSTFVRTRTNFLDALNTRFARRLLTPEEIASNDFQRFVTQFQRQNVLFPVTLSLARTWARAESDETLEGPLITRLRAAMQSYVRPDTGPKDIWVGSTLRIVSLAENETASAQIVEERGFNIAKTNFVSTQRAKNDLLDSFPAEERTTARYLASFIKPNCIMEADLTRSLREQRTAGLLVADRYDAGQIIVKRGELINKKAKAALDLLHAKEAATQSISAPPPNSVEKARQGLWPWIAAAGVTLLLLLAVVWKIAQRKAQRYLMPMAMSRELSGPPMTAGLSDDSWKERALQAEQQVAKTQALVRTGLMTQLAQWMSDKMTQKLMTQRAQLVDAHQRAAIEVAELEARLEKVQAPLQERLLTYERRIAELEKDLSIKGEENRELIRAKLQIVRKQLEIEREKTRLEFN